jgi:hypothetical protein
LFSGFNNLTHESTSFFVFKLTFEDSLCGLELVHEILKLRITNSISMFYFFFFRFNLCCFNDLLFAETFAISIVFFFFGRFELVDLVVINSIFRAI